LQIGASIEPDYTSIGASVNASADLADKRVTPTLAYGFGYDIQGRAGTKFETFSTIIMQHSADVEALTEALEDAHRDVRVSVIEALGEIGDPRSVPALTQSLSDRDWRIREAVAEALGELESSAASPALQSALGDTHWKVRLAAVEGIGASGDDAAAPAVRKLLKDPRPEIREAVVEAVEELLEEESD